MRIRSWRALAVLTGIMTLPFGLAARSLAAQPAVQEADSVVGPAFYVTDLARSLKFYREGLGMRVTMQFEPKGAALDVADRERRGLLGTGNANTVLSFSADPTAPVIMLLPDNAETGPRKVTHGHGYARVAIRIANLGAVAQRLRQAGFKPGEIRGAHGTHQVMMVEDPDGYTVELVERNKG
jgi:catechol 2,3-dioxygenase-like lactoylglutathione lyase family enzyme